jgi:hypothetical protein
MGGQHEAATKTERQKVMSKTTAPLLSFDAKGQIGKSMVASSWRGVKYMRRYVIPANPKTLAQQTVRSTFALLREMWKLAPALITAPWDSFAQGRPFLGMNKWVGENVRVLNGETDMNNFIGSPGAKGGLAPLGITVDDAVATQFTVTVDVPPAPPGWAISGAVAYAFLDQDPAGFFEGQITVAEDTAGPAYAVVLTGLTPAEEYQVGAFLRWTKPDGVLAYSVSLGTQAIAT